ncbi:MAG: hypothetical protein KGY80_08130 [Candidatus Thorarchaeota archaeon]|nr:hypothetical protein [Candidatus Thorarchaeota archaeon]
MEDIKSIITQSSSEGESVEPISKIAGIGGLLGAVAAALGLLLGGGTPLLPVPTISVVTLKNPSHFILSAVFVAIITVGLLLQFKGLGGLEKRLETNYYNMVRLMFLVSAATAVFILWGGLFWNKPLEVVDYVVDSATMGAFFTIFWQLLAALYVDVSKTKIGLLTGVLNAMFIPVLAIGQALGPMIVYLAYVILLVGQLFNTLFWWSPLSSVRQFARSPKTAKIGFGIMGVLTSLVGLVAVFSGPLAEVSGSQVWYPWSTMVSETIVQTSPALVFAFLASALTWVMLAPRLGARELEIAAIGKDVIQSGPKGFLAFLAAVGIFAAGQVGTRIPDAIGVLPQFLSIIPGAILILMGGLYISHTDVVTGTPMALSGIFIMTHPYVLPWLVLIPWTFFVITQVLVTIETHVRGVTYFSQPVLNVVLSIIASLAFILVLLGMFGSGPPALWPANRWFNVALFDNIPISVQTPTILVLPILTLLARNLLLGGYAHGRGYTGSEALVGSSFLFSLLIPIIAENFNVYHMALTSTAIMLFLYAISFAIVLSLNMNLANDVEELGYEMEGTFIKVATIVGLGFGALLAAGGMWVFSGFPSNILVGQVMTLLVTLILGLELLCVVSWLIAGIRLGMLTTGFSIGAKATKEQ